MQMEQLEGLCQNFATNEYRLLIIDSVISLFRTDFIGRGELQERQVALGLFLRRAAQMAEEFNICVFLVSVPFYVRARLTRCRQTKSCPTLVQALCLRELMVESQLEDMFSDMLLPLDFFFARDVVKNVLLRSLIRQVCPSILSANMILIIL